MRERHAALPSGNRLAGIRCRKATCGGGCTPDFSRQSPSLWVAGAARIKGCCTMRNPRSHRGVQWAARPGAL